MLSASVLLVAATTKKSSSTSTFVLLIVAFVVVVYFTLTRRRAAAKATAPNPALFEGAEIVTRSGIIGTVITVGPDEILLEIATGVRIRVLPGAIAQVHGPPALVEPPPIGMDEPPPEDRPDWGAHNGDTSDSGHAGDAPGEEPPQPS